jgi:REP element-mobilizing transposase RayT
MVLAFHVVFGAYGFWLPNDPRGSWSVFVASWNLFRFGKATTTNTRRSVAAATHDQHLREQAKRALKYPPVRFSGRQARAVARGFAEAAQESSYVIHACSILPEHVHLVIGHHARPINRLVGHLKARATQRLSSEGLWPDDGRPVWGAKSWKVFLFTAEDVRRAIAYVENNPLREGKSPQRWSFVTPFVANN